MKNFLLIFLAFCLTISITIGAFYYINKMLETENKVIKKETIKPQSKQKEEKKIFKEEHKRKKQIFTKKEKPKVKKQKLTKLEESIVNNKNKTIYREYDSQIKNLADKIIKIIKYESKDINGFGSTIINFKIKRKEVTYTFKDTTLNTRFKLEVYRITKNALREIKKLLKEKNNMKTFEIKYNLDVKNIGNVDLEKRIKL